jgi:phthalate 4,5-dioxygenase oxygenase subunit
MKTKTYAGMGHGFQAHDAFATASQGTIQDRTDEHLVSSDKAIVAARKLLEKAIRDVQEGREPPHVVRSPSENRFPDLLVVSDMIPDTSDWKEYTRSLAAEARARL